MLPTSFRERWPYPAYQGHLVQVAGLWLVPMVAISAAAVGVATTAPAGLAAEVDVGDVEVLLDEVLLDGYGVGCSRVTGSTLCASGNVRGSYGAPSSVPAYDPSCYLDAVVTARRGDACALH